MHLPKTAETVGLIGDEQLRRSSRVAIVVNAARGGIVDEDALLRRAARRAGSPAPGSTSTPPSRAPTRPLFDARQRRRHARTSGASTDEAQEKAGISVARSVRLALAGELVPDAVNVQGGVIAEDVTPGLPLAERLGRIFTALAGGVAAQLDVEVRGEITAHDVVGARAGRAQGRLLRRRRGAGVLRQRAAARRASAGSRCALTTERREPRPPQPAHRARHAAPTAAWSRCPAPSSGRGSVEKLVEVDGFDVDLVPADHMAFFRYHDRPGVVGAVGRMLGDAGVNIAGMQVSRDERGGHALMALTVDSAVPARRWTHRRGDRRRVRPRRRPGGLAERRTMYRRRPTWPMADRCGSPSSPATASGPRSSPRGSRS